MVDNVNPTTQFHPYQPVTDTPQAEARKPGALDGVLSRIGLDNNQIEALNGKMRDLHVPEQLESARTWARNNGGLALGGLAAAVIGAGLLSRRSRR
jgi:hypothetical protein